MANTESPFGFVPIGTTDGGSYHAKLRQVQFADTDSTVTGLGDMVSLTGTNDSTGTIPIVTQATAGTGNPVIGAIVGFEPNFKDESSLSAPNFRLANTTRIAYICYGSDVIYEVQTSNGTITTADFGQNIALAVGTVNTSTGISGMTVDVGTLTTATEQFRTIGISTEIENTLAEFANIYVTINENQDDHGTGV